MTRCCNKCGAFDIDDSHVCSSTRSPSLLESLEKDCPHDEYDSYPSSIPRMGYTFGVTCRQCKEELGRVWWEETKPLYFELVTNSKMVSDGSKLKLSDNLPSEMGGFAQFAK